MRYAVCLKISSTTRALRSLSKIPNRARVFCAARLNISSNYVILASINICLHCAASYLHCLTFMNTIYYVYIISFCYTFNVCIVYVCIVNVNNA